MFLNHIRLENFKGFDHFELSFDTPEAANRNWTILLGENGTGKSNLLKAIALVTGGSNALAELLGDTDSWIRYGSDKCVIQAILETQKGAARTIALQINRGDNLSKIISNNQEALSQIDDAFEYAQRNYFVVAYGASRRLNSNTGIITKNRNDQFGKRAFNVKNLFDGAYPLNPLTAWIIDLDYQAGELGLSIVRDALNDFLPGTKFHGIDKAKKQVFFETEGAVIPLEQLSDGYQNMASWIGDLLFRVTETFKDYKKPLEARGLLLIDEIDLHLHPKWQRRLIDFIRNKLPNFQVVATTHSPLTAQQADTGELFALNRNSEGKIVLLPFVGSPQKLLVNQLLMTPVFGLETDESLEMEQLKAEYRSLKQREKSLQTNEIKRLSELENAIDALRPEHAMAAGRSVELALFEKIEKHLNLNS